jgi:hypothetical protein
LPFDPEHQRHIYRFTETDSLIANNTYRYAVRAVYAHGVSDTTRHVYVKIDEVYDDDDYTSEEDEIIVEAGFKLYQNYPNPFNPSTTIRFSIPNSSHVDVRIYNIKGQLVKTLKNEFMEKGTHTVQWHGDTNNNQKVSSGIYFIRIQNEKNSAVRKTLLLK